MLVLYTHIFVVRLRIIKFLKIFNILNFKFFNQVLKSLEYQIHLFFWEVFQIETITNYNYLNGNFFLFAKKFFIDAKMLEYKHTFGVFVKIYLSILQENYSVIVYSDFIFLWLFLRDFFFKSLIRLFYLFYSFYFLFFFRFYGFFCIKYLFYTIFSLKIFYKYFFVNNWNYFFPVFYDI